MVILKAELTWLLLCRCKIMNIGQFVNAGDVIESFKIRKCC